MLTTEGDLAIGGGGPDWGDPPICDNLGYRVLSIKRAGLLRCSYWLMSGRLDFRNIFRMLLNNK